MRRPRDRRKSRIRWWGPLLAAATALALLPGSAGAATVFGADMTQPANITSANLSIVNVIQPNGMVDNGAPVSGILTSVRIKTSGVAGTGVIRVLAEVDHPSASTFTFNNTAPEIPVTVTADATNEGHITQVLTRRPIAAGQRLGWQTTSSSGALTEQYNAPSGECAFSFLTHSLGADLTYSTFNCNHNLLLASGTIEADADGDGFGDDTQDGCPTNATTHGPCPTIPSSTPPPPSPSPSPSPSLAKKKCKKNKKKHRSDAVMAKKCKKKHH
jgi:hypothetical protein